MILDLRSRRLSRCMGLLLCGVLVGFQFIRAEDGAGKQPPGQSATDKKPDEKKPEEKPGDKAHQKWQSLFDEKTLAGWKETEFGGGGEVLVKAGKIVISFGEGCTGITWQKEFPKVDYEVRLQAQRVEGTDFFCGLTFPVQDSPCSLIVGGWGGSVVGLSAIDGLLAIDNSTNKVMTFKKGQWYDIRLRVTKSRISAWIDAEQIVDFETKGHKLTIHPAVMKSQPFGICSYSTTAALRKIELRKLTEEEAAPEKPKVEPK